MTRTTLVVGMITAIFTVGCGDDATGDGGSGGGSSTASSSSSKASSSASGSGSTSTSASTSTSGSGSTSASTSASSSSGGQGAAPHCADAFRCDGVNGYFCYEVSGPDAAFETACAEELFGQYLQGPCGPEYDLTACVFDCAEPSVFSFAIPVDQTECETDGGTFYTPAT